MLWHPTDKDRVEREAFDTLWILRLGGLLAFLAMYMATWVKEPFQERPSSKFSELFQIEA